VRVLLVDLESDWRGGQAQALLLIQGLAARGHAVELVSVRGAALAERARDAHIPVVTASPGLRRLSAARLLRGILAERRFDIVQANEAHALTAAWLARAHRRAPLVVMRRVAFPLSRSRLALARYRAASRVLAVSQAVRGELLRAGLEAGRIAIVPDGVELPPRVSPEARQRARLRWGIAADERVAAYIASFSAEKGHALLLDAFGELRRTLPHCRLLLAGDGPLLAQMQEKARAANLAPAVIFAGFVRELEPIFAACDVFLFPSLNEGLGTSLLSAMAHALPVAAFSQGGIADAVDDNRNGLLVKEVAPRALAAAAACLFADGALAGRLGEQARKTIAERFTVDHMVQNTLGVFESLVAAIPSETL
jgi:glycosyltransferase involved in cell wall biosynthesis